MFPRPTPFGGNETIFSEINEKLAPFPQVHLKEKKYDFECSTEKKETSCPNFIL
jgi:hypothetical protein